MDILPWYILFIPIGLLALKAFTNHKATLICKPFRPEILNLGYVGRIGVQIFAAVTLFIPAWIQLYSPKIARKKLADVNINAERAELFQTQHNVMAEMNKMKAGN